MFTKKLKHSSHHHGCSCPEHNLASATENLKKSNLTPQEQSFLLKLSHHKYLPISKFILSSTKNEEAYFTALAPVYLEKSEDSILDVKARVVMLKNLAQQQLISLDYGITISNYDYNKHLESNAYKYFIDTVSAAKNNQNFICDTASIEYGSIALTDTGLNFIKD